MVEHYIELYHIITSDDADSSEIADAKKEMDDIIDELTDLNMHLDVSAHDRLIKLFKTLGLTPQMLSATGEDPKQIIQPNTSELEQPKKWSTPISDLKARLEMILVNIPNTCQISKNKNHEKYSELVDEVSKSVYYTADKYHKKPEELISACKKYSDFGGVMQFFCWRSNK